MTTKRRGICPVCDREYDVTTVGVMRMHQSATEANCPGSGRPPAHAFPDPLAAAEERGYRRAVQALRAKDEEEAEAFDAGTKEAPGVLGWLAVRAPVPQGRRAPRIPRRRTT